MKKIMMLAVLMAACDGPNGYLPPEDICIYEGVEECCADPVVCPEPEECPPPKVKVVKVYLCAKYEKVCDKNGSHWGDCEFVKTWRECSGDHHQEEE